MRKLTASKKLGISVVAAMATVAVCFSAACSKPAVTEPEETTPDTTAAQSTVVTYKTALDDEAILNSSYWAEMFPNQYNSWVDAGTKTYSIINTASRQEAYGKINSFLDMYNMFGNNSHAGCIGCHSTAYPALVEKYGSDFMAKLAENPQTIMREIEDMTTGIGCYSCHGNTPGSTFVSKQWITDAATAGGIETSTENLVCAQCHSTPDWAQIAVNGDSSSWSMLQYGLNAADYWEIYKDCPAEFFELAMLAITGESEFNQFMGSTMDVAGAVCSDCHMEKVSASGATYTDHAFQSVLTNENLYENCLSCHTDTVADRKAALDVVEAAYAEKVTAADAAVAQLNEAYTAAVAAGNVSEDVLAQVKSTYDKARFYRAYGSDYGQGIHLMGGSAANGVLDEVPTIVAEGLALLA